KPAPSQTAHLAGASARRLPNYASSPTTIDTCPPTPTPLSAPLPPQLIRPPPPPPPPPLLQIETPGPEPDSPTHTWWGAGSLARGPHQNPYAAGAGASSGADSQSIVKSIVQSTPSASSS